MIYFEKYPIGESAIAFKATKVYHKDAPKDHYQKTFTKKEFEEFPDLERLFELEAREFFQRKHGR